MAKQKDKSNAAAAKKARRKAHAKQPLPTIPLETLDAPPDLGIPLRGEGRTPYFDLPAMGGGRAFETQTMRGLPPSGAEATGMATIHDTGDAAEVRAFMESLKDPKNAKVAEMFKRASERTAAIWKKPPTTTEITKRYLRASKFAGVDQVSDDVLEQVKDWITGKFAARKELLRTAEFAGKGGKEAMAIAWKGVTSEIAGAAQASKRVGIDDALLALIGQGRGVGQRLVRGAKAVGRGLGSGKAAVAGIAASILLPKLFDRGPSAEEAIARLPTATELLEQMRAKDLETSSLARKIAAGKISPAAFQKVQKMAAAEPPLTATVGASSGYGG